METLKPEICQALMSLAQAIAAHPDGETLCHSLAGSLREVLLFDSFALVLADPAHAQLRGRLVSARNPYRVKELCIAADSEHAFARVWREQRPLVDPLPPAGLTEEELRALILVPLSNGDRRVGVLGFGFAAAFEPEEATLALLRTMASELAPCLDAYRTRQALAQECDRMRVLFEITNALVSKLPLADLFAAISEELSRVVAHDFAVVSLLDKQTGEIHRSALHSPGGIPFEARVTSCHPAGLPAGEALSTGKPVVLSEIDYERFPSPIYRRYADAFRSGCSIPLAGANGICGVLDLVRREARPFTSEEVDLLVQVARQIAVATENSLAYRELCELKDKLATEKLYLEDEIRVDQNVGNMVGEGPAFQAVWSGIQVVAPTDATVLIEGETGTGKELVARALHDLSRRNHRSFIKVNCAAIPATLLESELFGHEKGSFTGAFSQKTGRFELAHQGTLFLDEIGEIPLALQSKLLRAIQEQEFERVGGNRTIRVDVRFVAATNRDLKQMVDEGKFRSDLYYRLHVFPLKVPPLRERKEDIQILIRYFTQKYARRMNRPIDSIPATAIAGLTNYHWPGNIRELQNLIERSVILSPGRVLEIALPDMAAASPAMPQGPSIDKAAERLRILHALRECHGKVAGPDGAAARLSLRRTTLQSRMKKLGIQRQYG